MNWPRRSGDAVSDMAFISHRQVQRADGHRRYNRNDDTVQAVQMHVCVCVPAVLLAAVAEEPFLLGAARGVGVAFGTGGRFSAVPFSGVWKSQHRGDKLSAMTVCMYACTAGLCVRLLLCA